MIEFLDIYIKIKVKVREETMGKLLFDFLIFHKIKIMGVFNSTFI